MTLQAGNKLRSCPGNIQLDKFISLLGFVIFFKIDIQLLLLSLPAMLPRVTGEHNTGNVTTYSEISAIFTFTLFTYKKNYSIKNSFANEISFFSWILEFSSQFSDVTRQNAHKTGGRKPSHWRINALKLDIFSLTTEFIKDMFFFLPGTQLTVYMVGV